MKRHKLLSGETVRLDLDIRDIAFLKNLQRMAKDGISFFELERVAIGPGSPAVRGGSRVTREIAGSPLYRVAADIAMRVPASRRDSSWPRSTRTRGARSPRTAH